MNRNRTVLALLTVLVCGCFIAALLTSQTIPLLVMYSGLTVGTLIERSLIPVLPIWVSMTLYEALSLAGIVGNLAWPLWLAIVAVWAALYFVLVGRTATIITVPAND